MLAEISIWVRENRTKAGIVVVAGVLAGYLAFTLTASYWAFETIASEEFSPEAVATALEGRTAEEVERSLEETIAANRDELIAAYRRQLSQAEAEAEAMAELEDLRRSRREPAFSIPEAVSPPLPDEMFTSVLLIGADASGFLADVIIDVLIPSDGASPMMVSIPRDLLLPNRCTRGYAKVNSSLGGCRGVASGPELLALTVGDFTGIPVDHYVRVDFDGFVRVIDRMGGTTVCVGERAVRDPRSGLDLAPGCHQADGHTTLAWVRSRNPDYLVEGEWVRTGGSDFDRHVKQQDVLFQLADRLASYSSLASLGQALQNLADAVRMDSGWSVAEAAELGFRYRGISREQVRTLSIPVSNIRTSSGALALRPTRSFNDILAAAYPPAAR